MTRIFEAIELIYREKVQGAFSFKHIDVREDELRTAKEILHDNDVLNKAQTDHRTRLVDVFLLYKEEIGTDTLRVKITSWFNDLLDQNPIETLPHSILRTYFSKPLKHLHVEDIILSEMYSVDMVYYDFKLQPTSAKYHPTIPISDEDKKDLLLTKEGVDYEQLNRCSLFTIGGLVHRSSGEEEGIYLFDGRQTCLLQKEINVGILSFEHVAEVKCYDIDSEVNLKEMDTELTHEQSIYLTFPQLNFLDKTIGISLGGYLHFADGVDQLFYKVNHNTIKIHMARFNWLHRIYTYLTQIDPNKLKMAESDEHVLNVSQARSIDTLKAMLDLSQTFLIVLEHDRPLQFLRSPVSRLNWPKRYFNLRKQELPLRLADGRFPSYHYLDEGKGYVINTLDNLKRYYIDDTSDAKSQKFLTHYESTTVLPDIQHACFYRVQSYYHKPNEE